MHTCKCMQTHACKCGHTCKQMQRANTNTCECMQTYTDANTHADANSCMQTQLDIAGWTQSELCSVSGRTQPPDVRCLFKDFRDVLYSVYWLELRWYCVLLYQILSSVAAVALIWGTGNNHFSWWLGLRLVVWPLHGNHSTGQRKCQRRYLMFRPRSENRKVRPVPDRLVILVTSSNL